MLFLSTLLISMFVTMALIPILRSVAQRFECGLDIPDVRKVHCAPMPKVGGLAMALGALVPVFFVADGGPFVNSVSIGAAVICVFGLMDDAKGLSWKTKFAGQIAAALVVVFYGNLKICYLGECLPAGVDLSDAIAIPLTVLVIVGVTNAINLSDGLDGLAGGISLLIFICIGLLAYTGGDFAERFFVLALCAALIGAIFGFLRFNTYPATVFMGDTGSQLLGFLAVSLSLGITQRSTPLSPFVPLLLLGFPVLDTLTVMSERLLAGRSPFHPDKNHFHHKLMRLGLFHTEAVVAIYAITAALGTAAYFLRFDSEWLVLILFLIFSAVVITAFFLADQRAFRFHRTGFFDLVIKGRLKVFKDKQLMIRSCFPPVEIGVPLLFLAGGIMPKQFPAWASAIAAGFLSAGVLIWILRKEWLASVLRIAFYLMVPVILYLGQVEPAEWVPAAFARGYDLASVLLAFFTVLTLKFTRRQKGFKASPMDFLVVAIAVIVPNLAVPSLKNFAMTVLAVKVIVLFFSFDVLLGELRGKNGKLAVIVLAGLVVLAARSVI